MTNPTDLFNRLANTTTSMFRFMAVADEEIHAAITRHPDQAEALNDCFLLLSPPPLLKGKAEQLYRHHCRELLERVAAGQADKVDLPTRAEICAAFSDTSLAAPLTQDAAAAYVSLFTEIFGEVEGLRSEWAPHPSYPDAEKFLIDRLARRIPKNLTRRLRRDTEQGQCAPEFVALLLIAFVVTFAAHFLGWLPW